MGKVLKFCGIDLAVKRPSAVGLFLDSIIRVKEVLKDEEIIEYCKDSEVVAIDSPLSHSKGFRDVDKEMIKRGYKVLPPSWMRSLVDRAIRLSLSFKKVIETHPTSSMKNVGLDWRKLSNKKDIIDAVVCSLVAYFYHSGNIMVVRASDGEIFLLPKGRLEIYKIDELTFQFKTFYQYR